MKTASDPRHQERQKIVQELFAWQAHQKSSDANSVHLSPKATHIVHQINKINATTKSCAPEWELDHINQIDLAILRQGIYELVIEQQTPAKVIIDESIELAKEFGNESSPSFINGALGKAFLSKDRLRQMICLRFGVEENKVTEEANLKSDLNATDLEISDLLASLEKDYGMTFKLDNKPKTVGELFLEVEEQVE